MPRQLVEVERRRRACARSSHAGGCLASSMKATRSAGRPGGQRLVVAVPRAQERVELVDPGDALLLEQPAHDRDRRPRPTRPRAARSSRLPPATDWLLFHAHAGRDGAERAEHAERAARLEEASPADLVHVGIPPS